MSELTYIIPIAVGLITPFVIKRILPLLSRTGFTPIDKKTITEASSKKYPLYYDFLMPLVLTPIVLVPILIGVFGTLYIPQIIQGLFFNNNLIVTSDNVTNYLVLMIINIIGSILVLGSSFGFILWKLLPKDFKNYNYKMQGRVGPVYETENGLKRLFIAGLLYYIILSPIILFLLLNKF